MLLSVGLFDFDSQNLTELSDSVFLQRLTSTWHESDVQIILISPKNYIWIQKKIKKNLIIQPIYNLNRILMNEMTEFVNCSNKNLGNIHNQICYILYGTSPEFRKGPWFKVTLMTALLSCFGLSIRKFLKYFTIGNDFRRKMRL